MSINLYLEYWAELLQKSVLRQWRVVVVRLGVARVYTELVLIDVVQLGASERVGLSIDNGAKLVLGSILVGENARDNVGSSLGGKLHSVAEEIVSLEKRASIVNASCEVRRVQTYEGVDSSGVAADADEFRVLACHLDCVEFEIRNGVVVKDVTRVPVVWNAFVTTVVDEVAVFSSDCEEGLEYLTIKPTRRVLFGFVGHEAVNERPRSRLGDHTSKRRIEEVGVGVETLLERDVSQVCKQLQVILVLCLAGIVESLEPAQDKVVVLAVDVKVATSGRSVAFILVVRTRDALGLTEEIEWDAHTIVWSTDGPAVKVTVEDGTVNREERRKIDAHAEDLPGAFDELRDCGDAVVWQVAVIGHGVQARTWASLVIRSRGYERVRAGSINVLSLSIKRRSTVRSLSLLAAGSGACFFELL